MVSSCYRVNRLLNDHMRSGMINYCLIFLDLDIVQVLLGLQSLGRPETLPNCCLYLICDFFKSL